MSDTMICFWFVLMVVCTALCWGFAAKSEVAGLRLMGLVNGGLTCAMAFYWGIRLFLALN